MESLNASNNQSNVIDLSTYKNKKRKNNQHYLVIGHFYCHEKLALNVQVLALSIKNPFDGYKFYLCVDIKGGICAFKEGIEAEWQEISEQEFVEKVQESQNETNKNKLQTDIIQDDPAS
jgi:hypothetical protein